MAGRRASSTEHAQQTWRQHHVTVFSALALFDADQHAFGIDVAHFDCDGFGDAQAGAVAEHQCGAVLQAGNVVEEPATSSGLSTTGSVSATRTRGKHSLPQGISRVTR